MTFNDLPSQLQRREQLGVGQPGWPFKNSCPRGQRGMPGQSGKLLEQFWRISLSVTDDAIAKLYMWRKVKSNSGKWSKIAYTQYPESCCPCNEVSLRLIAFHDVKTPVIYLGWTCKIAAYCILCIYVQRPLKVRMAIFAKILVIFTDF